MEQTSTELHPYQEALETVVEAADVKDTSEDVDSKVTGETATGEAESAEIVTDETAADLHVPVTSDTQEEFTQETDVSHTVEDDKTDLEETDSIAGAVPLSVASADDNLEMCADANGVGDNTAFTDAVEPETPADQELDEDGAEIAEYEDSMILDTETETQSVYVGTTAPLTSDEPAETPVRPDSPAADDEDPETGTSADVEMPPVSTDVEMSPAIADLEAPVTSTDSANATPSSAQKSKSSATPKVGRRRRLKVKRNASKSPASKICVPTVTVTAPSDQSDNEVETTPVASTTASPQIASLPKRIESTNNLPPGWTRIAILRTAGKFAGRYDTTLYSDTKVKMRSLPNVNTYLEKIGQHHLLADNNYDFTFKQPFATPKSKTPARKEKPKEKPKLSIPKEPKGALPLKVCMKLKRKVPADSADEHSRLTGGVGYPPLESEWEVMKVPEKAKSRKKKAPASKKELTQLKLEALFSKRKSPKETVSESRFKSVLHHSKFMKKETVEEVEDRVSDKEVDVQREEGVSDVYLAEEQEDPYQRDEEGITEESPEKNEDSAMEVERAGADVDRDDLQSEECPSEASTTFELKSEESDSSLSLVSHSRIKKDPYSILSTETKNIESVIYKEQPPSRRRKASLKRSLSPSDSDASIHKKARLWRDTELEEDSSRSVGMCSDVSVPSQEESENQNMTTKVQKMHLSDSSSSKDIKDSASTTSSNSSSLACTSLLLSPSKKNGAKAKKHSPASQSRSRREALPWKTMLSSDEPANNSSRNKSQAVKTNGSPSVVTPGLHRDKQWKPPQSPFNLIQERLCHDPWKMLVATIFLDTAGADVAIPLLWKFLNRWPSADQARRAEKEHIAKMLQSMELNEQCAARVVRFSDEYVSKQWRYPIELYGIKKHGNDSFRIFCVPEWKQVTPDDQNLSRYLEWLTRYQEELGI